VLTELADTALSNTKMLNDKIIQNATANAEAAFEAALAVAKARTFSEAAKIQSEFVQQLTAKAVAQSKEFFDLPSRSTQHVIETRASSCQQIAAALIQAQGASRARPTRSRPRSRSLPTSTAPWPSTSLR
jgi:hypothetical protein